MQPVSDMGVGMATPSAALASRGSPVALHSTATETELMLRGGETKLLIMAASAFSSMGFSVMSISDLTMAGETCAAAIETKLLLALMVLL